MDPRLVWKHGRGLRQVQMGYCFLGGLSLDSQLESPGRKHSYYCSQVSFLYKRQREERSDSPSGDLPLGNRIISYTLHTGLLTASTRRQPLITPIFPQPAPITRTHVPKAAALARLSSSSTTSRQHSLRTFYFFHTGRARGLRSATLRRSISGALVRIPSATHRRRRR